VPVNRASEIEAEQAPVFSFRDGAAPARRQTDGFKEEKEIATGASWQCQKWLTGNVMRDG